MKIKNTIETKNRMEKTDVSKTVVIVGRFQRKKKLYLVDTQIRGDAVEPFKE